MTRPPDCSHHAACSKCHSRGCELKRLALLFARVPLPSDDAATLNQAADAAWASLHGPHASALQVDQRHAFAQAQLLLAALELGEGGASLSAVLRRVDLALIIAGDDDEGLTSGFAQSLHHDLNTDSEIHPAQWPDVSSSIIRCSSKWRTTPTSTSLDYESPVVLEELASHWPACKKWSPGYFSRLMGFRTVPVEVGSHCFAGDFELRLLTVNEFLRQFIFGRGSGGIGYLAQHPLPSQVPSLFRDFEIPAACQGMPHVNVWIGPKNTFTPFHSDSYRNILVQIVGTKRIELKANDVVEVVYLSPGEGLFIPSGYIHQVTSLETSVSLSFWWNAGGLV